MPLRKWYDEIDNEGENKDLADNRQFKYSVGVLICSIISLRKKDQSDELCEFCENFKKEFKLSDVEAKSLYKDNQNFDQNLDKHINIIKEQLKGKEHKKLELMRTFNRFIIEDDCDRDDYTVFEVIKKKLFL